MSRMLFSIEDLKEEVYMKQPPGYVALGIILSADLERQSMNQTKSKGMV